MKKDKKSKKEKGKLSTKLIPLLERIATALERRNEILEESEDLDEEEEEEEEEDEELE